VAPCGNGISDPVFDSKMNLDFRLEVNASLDLLGDPLGECDEYKQRRYGGLGHFSEIPGDLEENVKPYH